MWLSQRIEVAFSQFFYVEHECLIEGLGRDFGLGLGGELRLGGKGLWAVNCLLRYLWAVWWGGGALA